MIGMLGRIFFLSLQMLATVASNAVGFGNIPGSPAIEEGEALPELVSLITLTATVLLFLTDQHWEILRALAASYSALPPTGGFGAQFGLMQVANSLSQACFLALRITSPFIVYSVIVNLAIGLTNKLTVLREMIAKRLETPIRESQETEEVFLGLLRLARAEV